MRLNKQRKVYLGLLAVAGLALAADQLFFGVSGPQGASAAMQTSLPAAAVATSPTGQAAAPTDTANARIAGAARLAQILDTLSRTESLTAASATDAFAIPQEWLPAAATNDAAADNRDDSATVPASAPVSETPVVSAIMAGGARPAAIVNGRLMTVGQELSGVRLVAVEAGVAYVRTADGVVHELRIRTPGEQPR